MASSNSLNRPHPPPPPTPDNDTTVIVVVFVSVGCVLFLVFVAFAIWFLRRKCKKRVEKTETLHVDEHLKVKEAIVDGPRGPHAVVISVEDDVRIEEEVKKDEKTLGKGSTAKGMDEEHHGSGGSSSNSGVERYYSPLRK